MVRQFHILFKSLENLVRTETKYQVVLQNEVLKVLTYFGIFKHPLKANEILSLLLIESTEIEVLDVLDLLIIDGKIFSYDGYYFLNNDPTCISKRLNGEIKANELLPKAKKVAMIISYFPFVRFVGISGSLSKGYADEKTDFDFFIITKQNRLWICRTILHLFKKLTFIIGKQHYFCMNYFVDESAIEIEDKNIFALYEITSMIPVFNKYYYNAFIQENSWVDAMLKQHTRTNHIIITHNNRFKNLIEKFLNIFPLNKFNLALMKFTDAKWKRKWAKANYPTSEYDLAFRTRVNISKNHPKNHQKLVLSKLSNFY